MSDLFNLMLSFGHQYQRQSFVSKEMRMN